MQKRTAIFAAVVLLLQAANCSAAPPDNECLALLKRANSLRCVERYVEADALYSKVLSIDPKNEDALDFRGQDYLALDRYKEAIADANRCIKLYPDRRAYRLRGIALVESGNAAGVADLLKSYKMVQEHLTEMFLIQALLVCGRYDEARTYGYDYREAWPRLRAGNELCALADALGSHYEAATSDLGGYVFEKLRRGSELSNTRNAQPNQARAKDFIRDGAMRRPERKQLIADFSAKHPELSPAQIAFTKALISFFSRDYDVAIATADAAPANSLQPHAGVLVSYACIFKRDFAKADKELKALTEKFPTSQNVLDAVDLYHYQVDSRQASIAVMKKLLEKNAKNAAALVELAKIYRDINQPGEALKYSKLAVQANPHNAELLVLQSNILMRQDNYPEALKTLTAAVGFDKRNGAAYLMRASIYTQGQKWKEAIADLSQCVQLKHDLVKSLQARAACYTALNKPDLAQRDYITAITLNPLLTHQEFFGS